jgi:hypothetical protein
MIWDVHLRSAIGSGSRFFTHPEPWIQRPKRHRIPDPGGSATLFYNSSTKETTKYVQYSYRCAVPLFSHNLTL